MIFCFVIKIGIKVSSKRYLVKAHLRKKNSNSLRAFISFDLTCYLKTKVKHGCYISFTYIPYIRVYALLFYYNTHIHMQLLFFWWWWPKIEMQQSQKKKEITPVLIPLKKERKLAARRPNYNKIWKNKHMNLRPTLGCLYH